MGNRFGRNQRRRMRQEVASLREAWERESELARYLRRKGERDAETVRRVGSVLGEHFAALEAKGIRVGGLVKSLRLPSVETLPATPYSGPPMSVAVEMVCHELEAHWAHLQGDRLTGQVKVILGTPAGDMGYALSESALYQAPAKHIAEEIAKAFGIWLARKIEEHQRGYRGEA